MSRVVVRPKARLDIAEIAAHIGEENFTAATRFLDEVYGAFNMLANMPLMGSARRFRRESLRGLRLWRVPHFENYLVVYRPGISGVEVIRVLHGARNIEKLLVR
jgi:toxin ParE1/3/4